MCFRLFSLCLFLLMFVVADDSAIQAQPSKSKFPYEAVVEAAEAYARSGPGRRYYPTSKLAKGSKVTVHRHDPGGWYMIAPPADSFSWIRADHVKREAGTKGVLIADGIVVRVGSTFGDTRDVEQRRLSTGETVTIIGEKNFPGPAGENTYFKIKPPSGEWRWVAGQDLIPTSQVAQQERAENPFEVPVEVQKNAPTQQATNGPAAFPDEAFPEAPGETVEKSKSEFADGPLSTDVNSANVKQPVENNTAEQEFKPPVELVPETVQTEQAANNPFPANSTPEEQLQIIRQRINEIDDAASKMIQLELSSWDLEQIEHDYLEVKSVTTLGSIHSQIDVRLQAIEPYKQRKQQYDEFIALVNRTNRKEAELLAQLKDDPTVKSVSTPKDDQKVESAQLKPVPQTTDRPKFDGAGIVQRSATTFPNAPKFVLLAPDGRVLAYLHPDTKVDLTQYLGRSMGVTGQRQFVPALQSDLIRVTNLVPVRLK